MAVILNAKGTSSVSFQIAKGGPTLYQGTAAPISGLGSDGDLYIRVGTGNETVYQRISGTWEVYGTGIYLSIANNLSDLSNVTTAINNLNATYSIYSVMQGNLGGL